MFVMFPIPISNLQYFWQKNLLIDVSRQVIKIKLLRLSY